jgi:hypothetical protein
MEPSPKSSKAVHVLLDRWVIIFIVKQASRAQQRRKASTVPCSGTHLQLSAAPLQAGHAKEPLCSSCAVPPCHSSRLHTWRLQRQHCKCRHLQEHTAALPLAVQW